MQKLKSKEFWQDALRTDVGKKFLDDILEYYESRKFESPILQTQGLGDEVQKNGATRDHDADYFKNRTFITSLALLSLIFPDKDEYISLLQKYIACICEDYSWAVPSHYIRKYDDDERTCIDLVASETACMLAEISCLLGDRLGNDCLTLIKTHCKKRVFDSYCNRKYYWESGWNNWTTVCCGNIGIAMMRLSPELFEEQKQRILTAMSAYIAAFPNDGNCPEGLTYWHYGFGTYVWFADTLLDYTDGKDNLFNDKKIQAIASYGKKMLLCGGNCVSIGDCGMTSKIDPAMSAYLQNRYREDCFSVQKKDTKYWRGNVVWLPVTRLLLYGLTPHYADGFSLNNYYFSDSEQIIINKQKYSLFVKAGFNNESHNHNDIGSFILATPKYGQVFCDLGAATYFNGYFDDVRYTVLNTSSRGHSVPIVDGEYQKFGKEYCGSMVCKDNNISVDFAKAYGGNVKKLVRTFAYYDDIIELNDEFAGVNRLTERFVTLIKPEETEKGVKVGNVILCGSVKPVIQEVFEEKFYVGNPQTVYVIDFVFNGATNAVFKLQIQDN